MFNIMSRFSAEVLFSCELSADVENASYSIKLGFAVRKALELKANLSDANLSRANLSDANLSDANLSDANLSDANLSRANLSRANLSYANLSDANLSDANLSDANLSYANLSDANLSRANLSRANLSDADLSDANLSYANLSRADLSCADLSRANLLRADLSIFKQDFIAEVLRMPNELEFLREAIISGKIDGSTYSGECSCLAGTLATARGITGYKGDVITNGINFHAQADSPRERWFAMIKPKDTPENNQASKFALAWLDEAIAIRDNIRKTF